MTAAAKVQDCTECRLFQRCQKNTEEWDKIKAVYHIDPKHIASSDRLNIDEKRAVAHMNRMARECTEAVPV